MRPSVPLGLFVVACSVAALAGVPEPRVADYNLVPTARQAEPPDIPLNPIVAPSTAAPAVVRWGELMTVTVAPVPGTKTGAPKDWVVVLSTRTLGPFGKIVGDGPAVHYPCAVEEVASAEGRLVRLSVRVPARAPRDTYHLEVAGPGGLVARRVYAVRVLGAGGASTLRVAAISDHQLKDPSSDFSGGELNSGDWPRCCEDDPDSMMVQQAKELAFWDPDIVLYAGDLVFGTDYRSEYRDTLELWWSRPLATFYVPGNHDGLAIYKLALKDKWWKHAAEGIGCVLPLLKGDVDTEKVFGALACVYGDLKKMLYQRLAQDGLEYFRRILGPSDYHLDLGPVRLVGVNSYSGSPARRHAFVLSLDFLGIDFGAATVDNYGGYLEQGQLDWLEAVAKDAAASGESILLLCHHDPRGNSELGWGERYHENLPFPTEPLGLRSFQEWNFDGEWNSAGGKGRGRESQTDNSGVRLLRLLARYGGVVVTGHIHADRDVEILPGREVVSGSGLRASRRIRILRLATAGSAPLDDDGYWGYRLLEFQQGQLKKARYYPAFGWPSVPSGNLIVQRKGRGCTGGRRCPLFRVANGLPTGADGRLRAWLPALAEGVALSTRGHGRAWIEDTGDDADGKRLYFVRAALPGVRAGRFPVAPGDQRTLDIYWERAAGNRQPEVDFSACDDPRPGVPCRLDASATSDPDGDRILHYLWEFGDGRDARGRLVEHAYLQPGTYRVRLTVADEHGATATRMVELVVAPPSACSSQNVTCAAGSAVLLLLLLGMWMALRRLRIRRN